MQLRHVERLVHQTDHAFPAERQIVRRQQHRRIADRDRDIDVMAHVLDGLFGNRVHDPLDDLVEPVGRRQRNVDQEFLAAPAHDHVRFPQRVAQSPRDRDQHGVARRMSELVVDELEVIEIDQQKRLDGLRNRADSPVGLAPAFVDEVLEMAPVVECGERIAAALEAQFAVLRGEQAVGRAELAVQHSHDAERRREYGGQQPPDALLKLSVLQFDGLQAALAVEQFDLAFALLRFAHLALGLLALDRSDLVAQLAFAVEEGDCALVIARIREMLAILDEEVADFRHSTGPLEFLDGLLGQAFSGFDVPQTQQREADVRLVGRGGRGVAGCIGQLERALRQFQHFLEIVPAQVHVGQVDERHALRGVRLGIARDGERFQHRLQFLFRLGQILQRRRLGILGLGHAERAVGELGLAERFLTFLEGPGPLLCLGVEHRLLVDRLGPPVGALRGDRQVQRLLQRLPGVVVAGHQARRRAGGKRRPVADIAVAGRA